MAAKDAAEGAEKSTPASRVAWVCARINAALRNVLTLRQFGRDLSVCLGETGVPVRCKASYHGGATAE